MSMSKAALRAIDGTDKLLVMPQMPGYLFDLFVFRGNMYVSPAKHDFDGPCRDSWPCNLKPLQNFVFWKAESVRDQGLSLYFALIQ